MYFVDYFLHNGEDIDEFMNHPKLEYENIIEESNYYTFFGDSDAKKFNNAGCNLFRNRDFKQAAGEFDNAIKKDEQNSINYFNKGLCYLNIGNNEAALDCFNLCLKIKEDVTFHFYKAEVLTILKRDQEAIYELLKAIKIDNSKKILFEKFETLIKSTFMEFHSLKIENQHFINQKERVNKDLRECIFQLNSVGTPLVSPLNKVEYNVEKLFMTVKNLHLDEELFFDKTFSYDIYLCKICTSIVKDPISCGECEDLFCTNCINKYVSSNDKCPYCRDSPFKKRKINKGLKSYLESLVIQCPLNCPEKLKYCELSNHFQNCLFIEKKFTCQLCSYQFISTRNDDEKIEKHNQECKKLNFECQFCKNQYLNDESREHMEICSFKPLNCKDCKFKYPEKFKKAHDEFYCNNLSEFIENIYSIIDRT